MPDVFTQMAAEGAVLTATVMRTYLGATAKIRLCKTGFAPVVTTPRATYVLNEADFSGYAAITVAAWDAVGTYEGGSQAGFSNDTSAFFQNDDGTVPNDIGAAWLEDVPAGPAVPKVLDFVVFDPPVPMVTALAALNLEWMVRYPGPGVVSYDY